jgi:hypothetical protein
MSYSVSLSNLYLSLLSAAGMVFVAVAAVSSWRTLTRLPYRWFCVGAGLWLLAMLAKQAMMPVDELVYPRWVKLLPPAVLSGALYVGLQCALIEIGLTWLAARLWPALGRDASRAIGIGIGAGAFEAFYLGALAAAPVIGVLADGENSTSARAQADSTAQLSAFFWLIPSIERVIAILVHAATRALVVLGSAHRRPWMIFWGFVIFALGDALVTAFYLSGLGGKVSMWWLVLLYLPLGLVSIPILKWCYAHWGSTNASSTPNHFDVASVNQLQESL